MKKYTKKRLNEIIKDVKTNFTEIVDYIIYFDSIDEDEKSWELIYKIEELDDDTEIKLILSDFKLRDLTNSPTLLYNSILYGLVNNEDSKKALIGVLKNENHESFKTYLSTLNKNKGRDGDLNIEYIMNQFNENSSNKNKP